jgi:hypothetical protein
MKYKNKDYKLTLYLSTELFFSIVDSVNNLIKIFSVILLSNFYFYKISSDSFKKI